MIMSTKPSPFKTMRKARARSLTVDPSSLVKTSVLAPEKNLPFVIEPAVADIDCLKWMTDQRKFVEEKLLKHGAILFRGFPIETAAQFQDFSQALYPELFGDYGDLPHAEGKIYGVTPYPPDMVILFHNESSHMHRWDMRQIFFCRIPAAEGGTTPVADCRKVYQALSPEERERFKKKGLRYVRNFIEGVDVSWQDFFKTEDKAEVEAICNENGTFFEWKSETHLRTYQIAPAVLNHPQTGEPLFFNQIQLHHISFLDKDTREALLKLYPQEELPRNVYFGDGEPIPDELAQKTAQICWDNSVGFPWQKGDILLADNMLVTHARNTYTPPRDMYVAMAKMVYLKDFPEWQGVQED